MLTWRNWKAPWWHITIFDVLPRPVRALKAEEAREVMAMVRRIAAIILMQPALDENYHRVAEKAYEWPGAKREKVESGE